MILGLSLQESRNGHLRGTGIKLRIRVTLAGSVDSVLVGLVVLPVN